MQDFLPPDEKMKNIERAVQNAVRDHAYVTGLPRPDFTEDIRALRDHQQQAHIRLLENGIEDLKKSYQRVTIAVGVAALFTGGVIGWSIRVLVTR